MCIRDRKISAEIINKVSNNDNSKNELINSSDKIVENKILEGDIMKIDSDDIEIVIESERVMGCKGVETNVYQLEKMCIRDSSK